MFEFLTRMRWKCGDHRFDLRRNGEYRWTVFSDYLEHDESGRWDFRLSSDTTGCLILGSRGVVRFASVGTLLQLRCDLFHPVGRVRPEPAALVGGAGDLTPLPDPPLYARLVGTAWKPAGRRNMRHHPAASITYLRDGRRVDRDSSGRCTRVLGYDLTGVDLIEALGWGTCDRVERGPDSRPVDLSQIRFDSGLLVIDNLVYRPVTAPDSMQVVSEEVRGLLIRALYAPRIDGDQPFLLGFEILNGDGGVRHLERVGVGDHRWIRDSLTFMPLAVREYHGLELRPGAWFRDTLTVTVTSQQLASKPMLHIGSWNHVQSFDEYIHLFGFDN